MTLKKHLMKLLMDHDIIPNSIRWNMSVAGLGTMYSDLYALMIKEKDIAGIRKLNRVMFELGLKQGPVILKKIEFERNLEGCAYVLLASHRLFGMKSKIVEKNANGCTIHVSRCSWGTRIDGWTPATCSSIANYETGVVKSLLPNASHRYTKKRSSGDDVCEIIITIDK